VLRALTEDALIGGLSDERDHLRVELPCNGLEPLVSAGEVSSA
jgi:hypothetical protein